MATDCGHQSYSYSDPYSYDYLLRPDEQEIRRVEAEPIVEAEEEKEEEEEEEDVGSSAI